MNVVVLLSVVFCLAALGVDLLVLMQEASGKRALSLSLGQQQDSLASVAILFRALRWTRVISLLRTAKTIRFYLATLGNSLVAVGNIFILFFVLINTFALLLREFFHFVQLKPKNSGGLDTHGHFQSWVQSFGVMARATTGEGWQYIAYDLMVDSPGCVDVFSVSAESIRECVPLVFGLSLSLLLLLLVVGWLVVVVNNEILLVGWLVGCCCCCCCC